MAQKRNIAVCIILTIVTCGIYGLYWFVCLTEDANTLKGGGQETSGGMALLFSLITCGIYSFYWAYKMGEKLDDAKTQRGIPSSNSGVLYIILFLISGGLIAYALMQNEINKMA